MPVNPDILQRAMREHPEIVSNHINQEDSFKLAHS